MDRRILITGIGGGGVGLQIFKALQLTDRYKIFGADASTLSIGLYLNGFEKTYILPLANNQKYIKKLLSIAKKENIGIISPGSEAELNLISKNRYKFQSEGILVTINEPEIIELCSDKMRLFEYLRKNKIPIPETRKISSSETLNDIPLPCIVKPVKASGGSRLTFIAEDIKEARFFINYIEKRGITPLIQEYITSQDEFTTGVISDRKGSLIGSIAIKRLFHNKLSYVYKYEDRVISTGVSQGIIKKYKRVREQAEKISSLIQNKWALNIQGRLYNGIFYPFEINPRHSGTTYIKALAGFNEPDILIQKYYGCESSFSQLKIGYYLRMLREEYIKFGMVNNYV